MGSLNNQVAIITGASEGIGKAIAELLAAQGMRLMLAARSEDKLATLAAQLQRQHPDVQVKTCVTDVRNAERVAHLINQTLSIWQRIDVLINNAGVAPKAGLMQELSVEEIDKTIDTNLKGALYAMRGVLPTMVHQHSGVIININSVAGKTAYPYWSVYDASKFGLHAATEAVAQEQRSNGIKVVGIYPGAVDTNIWDSVDLEHDPDRQGMLRPQDVADTVLHVLTQPQNVFTSEIMLAPLKPAL